ncbi:MAG: hypothetical protein LBC70_10465 [Chitinispirillales bacterium]|nr:hypothetical protein [Chitinispirillales bacterium]
MRDPEVAKAIIETLLETEVIEIQLRESEHNKPMTEDDKRPRYMRVDYLALIKTKSGESQKSLIKMQKASGSEDILRFREYLAISGYMPKPREDTIYYKYPVEAAYHKRMLDILNYIGTNPEERKKLDEEAYWERFDYHNSGKLAEALEALEGQKEENKKQKEEMRKKDTTIAENDALIAKLMAQIDKA